MLFQCHTKLCTCNQLHFIGASTITHHHHNELNTSDELQKDDKLNLSFIMKMTQGTSAQKWKRATNPFDNISSEAATNYKLNNLIMSLLKFRLLSIYKFTGICFNFYDNKQDRIKLT